MDAHPVTQIVSTVLPYVVVAVLAVLLAVPVWLFYQEVGADEMAFAVLSDQLTSSDTAFDERDMSSSRDENSPGIAPADVLKRRKRLRNTRQVDGEYVM